MKTWIDVSETEKNKHFINSENVTMLSYDKLIDKNHKLSIYLTNQHTPLTIESKDENYIIQRFNEIAEAIGLNHRLGQETKEPAISVFRQQEEAKRKRKVQVAEI